MKICVSKCENISDYITFNSTCVNKCPNFLKQTIKYGFKYCEYPCEDKEDIFLHMKN